MSDLPAPAEASCDDPKFSNAIKDHQMRFEDVMAGDSDAIDVLPTF